MLNLFEHFFWNTPHPFFVSLPTLNAFSGRKNSIMVCWGTRFNTGRPVSVSGPRCCHNVLSKTLQARWQPFRVVATAPNRSGEKVHHRINHYPNKNDTMRNSGCLSQSGVGQAAIDILPKVLLSNHLVKPQISYDNLSNGAASH